MQESINKFRFASWAGKVVAMVGFLCLLQVGIMAQGPEGLNRTTYDFTGDLRTDFVTLSAASATAPLVWKVQRNPGIPGPGNAFIRIFNYGIGGDSIIPGDYRDGAKWEPAVFRSGATVAPFSGLHFEGNFPETSDINTVEALNWGQAGDTVARIGDYDGDGKIDEAVMRTPVGGTQFQWYIKGSAGTDLYPRFGGTGAGVSIFRFQGADITGDGRDELVIASVNTTTNNVTWFFGDSITGAILKVYPWGNFQNDFIVNPADYTGDGRADLIIMRAGGTNPLGAEWHIFDLFNNVARPVVNHGMQDPDFLEQDFPCRGDYDGDGIHDIAVFRPSTREFFWLLSSAPGTAGNKQGWGDVDDTALCTFFSF